MSRLASRGVSDGVLSVAREPFGAPSTSSGVLIIMYGNYGFNPFNTAAATGHMEPSKLRSEVLEIARNTGDEPLSTRSMQARLETAGSEPDLEAVRDACVSLVIEGNSMSWLTDQTGVSVPRRSGSRVEGYRVPPLEPSARDIDGG